MSNALFFVPFLSLFLSINPLYGQKQVTHQDLIWYGYFLTVPVNDKWYVQTEVQERHFINPARQHQLLIRSHIYRSIGQSGMELSAGMYALLANPREAQPYEHRKISEIRPHLEFGNIQKAGKIILDHRYRAEARFFWINQPDPADGREGYAFGNFRFRYRFQVTFPIFKIKEKLPFKIKISDEIHLNAGKQVVKNIFDQNRIYGGISLDPSPNLTLDIGYMNWYQQQSSGNFINRNILRFTVFHKIT